MAKKWAKRVQKREKLGFLDVWLSFLGIDSLIFSDSVHEVRGPCVIVRDRAHFFWKISFSAKRAKKAPKGPKNRVFGPLRRIDSLFFAINDLK